LVAEKLRSSLEIEDELPKAVEVWQRRLLPGIRKRKPPTVSLVEGAVSL
jgi:hypothetical protein